MKKKSKKKDKIINDINMDDPDFVNDISSASAYVDDI